MFVLLKKSFIHPYLSIDTTLLQFRLYDIELNKTKMDIFQRKKSPKI